MRRILFVLLILLIGLPGAHAANWTIAGDAVFWEGTFGKITVWPHTGTGLTYQEQYANVTWNLAANTLDFAFVFDYPISGSLFLWSNITETRQTPTPNTIEQTFSCSAPKTHSYTSEVYTCVYANGTIAWRQFYTWKALDDLSVKANLTYVNFTSSNVTVLGWKDITGQVNHQTYGGKDYYLITNVAMAQGQTRQVRWTYNTPFNSTGKWSLMAKLSSDSIATAYSANRYLILDPWWNTSYSYSRIINVTNLDASLVLQQNYTVNLTFNHTGLVVAGKSNVSGLDVRVVYNDTTELDRRNVTAWNTSATTIIFKLQANISAGGADTTNYKIYYGNLGAANPPTARANVYLYQPPFVNASAFWVFEKPGSNLTRLEDISGNGNNMTIVNGNWTLGPYGYGLAFNGTNGYATAPKSSSLNITNNFTMDFDVYVASLNGGCCDVIFNDNDANIRGLGTLYFINSGTVEYLFVGGGNIVTDSVGKVSPGRRYRILITWDGVTQSMYINGVFNASTANTATLPAASTNTELGAQAGTLNLNGTFYRANLYNRSFTSPEVAALYIGTEPTLTLLAETGLPLSFDFNITVYRGWNLLTMWKNYTLLNLTNLTAAPTNITVAQCWNAVNQSWAKYNWTNSSGNSSYVCEKGLAAFVLIGRNDTLNFTNISFDTGGSAGAPSNWTVNVSLYAGYNYVGIPGNVSLLNASNWTSSFRFVSCWNASKQEYFTYLNRTTFAGGLHNTSVCKEGTGVVLYSLVNETIEMKREFDASGIYVAAIVLFLAGAAWVLRWRARSGET